MIVFALYKLVFTHYTNSRRLHPVGYHIQQMCGPIRGCTRSWLSRRTTSRG